MRVAALQELVAANLTNLFAADGRQTLWQRLDEATRGRLALTLIGLLLLLALVVLLIALSARMMRRIARHRPPTRIRETSDWDRTSPAKEKEL